MLITTDKVATFNPCANRFDNFKLHYPNYSGDVHEFLSLDNITYQDKVWVCVRLMSRNQKFYWARACAFSVLEIFEAKHPDDKRVRELLEFLNTITDVTKLSEADLERLQALRSAAYAAYAAAGAASYAACAAADAASYAAAGAAYAAYAAADAGARTAQQEFNLIVLNDIMEMDI